MCLGKGKVCLKENGYHSQEGQNKIKRFNSSVRGTILSENVITKSPLTLVVWVNQKS